MRRTLAGLHFDAQLDRNDREAQTVMFKVSAGLLDQCSFAFRVVPGGQEWNDDYTLRTIREVDLDRGDVSVCNYGASPTTSVVARSRRRAVANGLYAYKAHALALRGGNKASIDRTRRLIYLNEAGRRR